MFNKIRAAETFNGALIVYNIHLTFCLFDVIVVFLPFDEKIIGRALSDK